MSIQEDSLLSSTMTSSSSLSRDGDGGRNEKRPWVFIIEDDGSTDCSEDEIMYSEDLIGSNSLQAEVYRLGLRLEEIDEEIGEQIRSQRKKSKGHSFNDHQFNGDHSNQPRKDSVHHTNGYEKELTAPRSRGTSSAGQSEQTASDNIERRFEVDLLHNNNYNKNNRAENAKELHSNLEDAGESKHNKKALSRQAGQDTSSLREVNPEESGYYTGRSQHAPSNGLEEKYLSRSLKNPPPAAYSCAETEERVGSWVSKSNQSVPRTNVKDQSGPRINAKDQSGHRRRTKSSEMSSMKSNSTVRQRRRRSQTLGEPRKPKSTIGPDTGRPFTNNSAEDSGFLDADHRSHVSRERSNHSSPTHRWNGAAASLSQRRSVATTPATTTTAGEQYRERLDSLRNFIQAKREDKENNAKQQTPRSWVRGKSPSVYSLQSESIVLTHDNFESPSSLVLPNKTPPRGVGGGGDGERRKTFSPNKHRFEQNEEEERFNGDDEEDVGTIDVKHPMQEKALETLQHEMHDIRDLVLDLKSSLHVNSNANPRESRRHELPTTPPKPKTNTIRESPRHHTPRKDDSLDKKHLEVYEKLASTMDRLSSKIEDLDRRSKTSVNSVASDSSSISAGDLYDENFNSISKHDNSMIPHIQSMSRRVDNLQEQLSERERQNKLKECDQALLRHQAGLVKGLESKLDNLEKKLEKSPRRDADVSFNTQNAVCQLCGGLGAHTHHEEEYKQYHSTPAHRTPRVNKRPPSPKGFQRTISKTLNDVSYTATTTPPRKHNTSGRVHISPPPSVIHHYHTFCGTAQQQDANDKSFARTYLTSPIQQSQHTTSSHHPPPQHHPHNPPQSTLQHVNNTTMEGDNLYDSISSATLAAKRMENLSKRMLSTIAADLYNSNEMVEY